MSDREFDLVLYGATGFVGKLTAHYLSTAAPEGARIALAGRSVDKLVAVRDGLGPAVAGWELIVADAADETHLDAMVRRTRVVVTTVGPYAQYGLPLVAACAKAGTHYADLTGETLFVRDCIDRYHDVAVGTGARIVNSCGFDSVPSDLSVWVTHKQTLADDTGELTDTTLVAKAKGGLSGGTVATMLGQIEAVAADRSLAKVVTDPYALSPDRALEPYVGRQSDQALQQASSIDASLDGWVATFLMASYNTRVVRRSNALLGYPYGKNFRYREVMSAGRSRLAPVIAAGVAGTLAVGATVGSFALRGPVPRLVERILPKPGSGPSEKTRNTGWFTMSTYAHTTSGAKYRTIFAAHGDPGYQATSVMLGEAGLALAFDGDALAEATGVVTPA
ncbi:MAG TPA: saccharopine dehydrogenase NADP-binding domain-containing protein, partial [Aldersonia sp.]